MIFLPEQGMFVTISIMENEVVNDLRDGRVRNVDTRYRTRFLLQMLLHISQLYLVYLRRIDRLSSNTEARLHASVRNKELIQMLNLEKSLVYFSTSLKSDEVTLNKIAQGRIIPLYEDDQDLLEDVLVEVHQAIEMANIYSGTLSGNHGRVREHHLKQPQHRDEGALGHHDSSWRSPTSSSASTA